jgi:gamma-glutamyl hercynylcysteine S-oxide synthase
MDERLTAIVVDGKARTLDRAALAPALQAVREQTLRLFAAYEAALGPGLLVPCTPELNPPLWELGHVGWFVDWWIGRFPQHTQGLQAEPLAPRSAARQARRGVDADALYNSSTVPHDRRWQQPLPDADATREDLDAGLSDTLALLAQARDDDQGLYFFRLALFHECMHVEAAVYMAQTLGFDPYEADTGAPPSFLSRSINSGFRLPSHERTLGWSGPGFAFDNELGAHAVTLEAFEIDTQPVSWARFLPFVEAGGYQQPAWWSKAGQMWLQQHIATAPRYLRKTGSDWEQQRFGRWQSLPLDTAACHLTLFEAEAWCRWAGRRLPTEAEWEAAALEQQGFGWGSVWEWTASAFAPYPGFTPHPYCDYSAPWFDGRPVLKGASAHTLPLMRHAKYRNYFTPDRNDVMTGFRSVAR